MYKVMFQNSTEENKRMKNKVKKAFSKAMIIIVMDIFKCYFSREHIALLFKQKTV